MDFIRDEGRMAIVFEGFVRNFFRKEQNSYKVRREHIKWAIVEPGCHDTYLPGMETDASLTARDHSRKIVLETKYYKNVFKSHLGTQEKLISANLYQLYAYLKNLESRGGVDTNCEGILLYAAVDQLVDFRFSLPGHDLRVKTLNLNQDWKLIHTELLGILA